MIKLYEVVMKLMSLWKVSLLVLATTTLTITGCSTTKNSTTILSPRDVVLSFSTMAFDQGKVQEAILKYISPDMKDHNPKVQGSRKSILAYLEGRDWSKGGPKRTIYRVIQEDDLVVVHHHLLLHPDTKGIAAVEIFRVKDGLIIEHWDALQPVPENSPNDEPMFETNGTPYDYDYLRKSQ